MNKFINNKKAIIGVLTSIIFIMSMVVIKENSNIETATEELSTKKIGWGIKRENNHIQPDVGSKNKEVLEANNGICMGNKDKQYIYLTFDEGYEAGYTSKILDILKENNVTATFFITAHYLNSQPELVKRMIDEGHIVGNHTPKYLMSEIEKL